MGEYTFNRGAFYTSIFSEGSPQMQAFVGKADEIVAYAKIFCPVQTGYLRSTIRRGDPVRTETGVTIEIGAEANYAAAVHEGAGSGFAPSSWQSSPGAQPFLTQALNAAGV